MRTIGQEETVGNSAESSHWSAPGACCRRGLRSAASIYLFCI